MAAVLRSPAPAKLNLMLHITGRRDDGYHRLQSVFQFIDLCDRLEFEVRDDGVLERGDSQSPVAAREDILHALGASGDTTGVVMNGGATEGLNHALKGLALRNWHGGTAGPRRRLVYGAIEHYAVKAPAHWLAERFGFEEVVIPVDETGRVDVDAFLTALDPDTTAWASLHWANNEVGTLQPVHAIGAACRERGIPFVCDAVQVLGKLDVTSAMEVSDAVALSAHKFYGPKGTGALALRRDQDLDPLLHGATQEEGRRAGTHAVANIVA